MTWFDEIITPDEQQELEIATRSVLLTILAGRLTVQYLPELIDQRFGINAQ
jgi:hypothetical protein